MLDIFTDVPGTDFRTHLNYIKCMNLMLDNLNISIQRKATAKLPIAKIEKFLNLSRITATSVSGELKSCFKEPAYSQVVAPWIPVKCYYRLYYLESVFIYLLGSSQAGFGRAGHSAVRNELRDALIDCKISFAGGSEFTKMVTWDEADSFKSKFGATISRTYYQDSDCPSSVRGKLAEYICVGWLESKPFDNFLTNVAKQAKRDELMPSTVCLIDFFYLMRLKANYRDVDFLDFERTISEKDALDYVNNYVQATEKYASAIIRAIQQLRSSRLMLHKV